MYAFIPMVKCTTAVTQLLTHWSYCSLALSHRYMIGLCRHCTLCTISEQLFINKTGCYGSIRCYEISVYFMLCIDSLHCHWPNVRESPCVIMWLGYYWKTYYQESYYSIVMLSNGFCGIWSQGHLHDKGERREILTWHTISTDTKYWMIYWLTHGHSGLTHLPLGLALLTLSWDKNWDSHSLVNGYPSFYPRIALVAPSPGQHCRHFTDGNSICIFVNEKFCILINISLNFVSKGQSDNNPQLA